MAYLKHSRIRRRPANHRPVGPTFAAGTPSSRPGSADWGCAGRRVAATAGRLAARPGAGAVPAVGRDPEPLDLMLYNKTADPFGAHVAVWMAPGEILHLCHEIGVPAIWTPAMFAARPRYATLIGLKRVTGHQVKYADPSSRTVPALRPHRQRPLRNP